MQDRTNFLNEVYFQLEAPEDFKAELQKYAGNIIEGMNQHTLNWEMWDLYAADLFLTELALVVCQQEERYYGRRFAIKTG